MDGDCLWRRLARPARVVAPRTMRFKRKKKKDGLSNEWSGLGVPDMVATALLEAGITKPTEIQSRAITTALSRHCDIIGASETGSGKTLAFTIPILHYVVTNGSQHDHTHTALQVDEESVSYDKSVGRTVVDLNTVITEEDSLDDDDIIIDEEEEEGCRLVSYRDHIPDEEFHQMLHPLSHAPHTHSSSRPLTALILTPTRELALQIKTHIDTAAKYTGVIVCVLVGGMAVEKQRRILDKHPHIVVATPGRLWKLMKEEGHPHLCSLQQLQFFVLDEADRMIEHGHFVELSLIVERISADPRPPSCRTFIFSATLTLPRRRVEKGRAKKNVTGQQTLESLMSQLGLSESSTHIIDLTTSQGTVGTLTECKVMCTHDDKDVYLYYFLTAYPGRTLIFVNSVSYVHRLCSLLTLLHLHPLPLHSGMQQRQRLKNMDRYSSSNGGIMIATDVAARGLDIANIQHVLHYHLPRNTEVYVHRSGRTARGKREGLSVALVGPSDIQAYRIICRTLNRDEEMSGFPVDTSFLRPLRLRVQLARKIELAELRMNRKRRSHQWLEQTAVAMDILLDDDLKENEEDKRLAKQQLQSIQAMKGELNKLLSKAAVPQGVQLSYPAGCGQTNNMDSILYHLPSAMSGGHDALSAAKKLKH